MRVKYLAHSRCLVSGSQYYCSRRKLSILGNPKGVEVSGCGRVAYHRGGLTTSNIYQVTIICWTLCWSPYPTLYLQQPGEVGG